MILKVVKSRCNLRIKVDGFPAKSYSWLTPEKAVDRYFQEVGMKKPKELTVIIKA